MKKALLILLLFTLPAYASEYRDEEPTTQTQSVEQHQQQSQDQSLTGGDNSATGGAGGNSTADGGNSSIGDISTTISNKRPYRNAPNAYAPPVSPTVSCFKGASGSASAPGFGFSIGAGKIDKGCVRRELIRLAPESHKLYLFCNEPTILAMFEDFQTCLDYVPREINKEVMPNATVDRARDSRPPTYDDTALTQQIEALVTRVGAVETKTTQTRTLAKESQEYAVAASSPFKDMQAELRLIQRVEK